MNLTIRYRSALGLPRISVTQVLGVAGRIDDRWFSEEAAWRGSQVHALTEVFDRGEPLEIPPGLEGYLEAYASFRAIVRPVYVSTELAVTSEALQVGGRIDRVCSSLWGTPGILDFKTGDPSPWHAWQLAAYNLLHPTGARWACYLGKSGRYRLIEYSDSQDYAMFRHDAGRVLSRLRVAGNQWVVM